MAYVSKELAARIKAEVKAATPKGWRVSVKRSQGKSGMSVHVLEAPASIRDDYRGRDRYDGSDAFSGRMTVLRHEDFEGDTGENVAKILAALNCENHDNSDSQRDHFDIGYYSYLYFGGEYDEPVKLI